MKRIEDIEEFEDIDSYYGILEIVNEIFQDRVEAHKHLVTANKEIERLNKENEELKKIQCTFLGTGCKAEIERLNNIINELEKYINNEWNAIEKEPDNSFFDGYDTCIEEMKKDILDKIKELKGSDKE